MTEQKTRIRITHLMLGLAVISVIAAHGYSLWRLSEEEKKLTPRLALNSVIKVLLSHHKKAARFPENFAAIDARIWPFKPAPVFGHEGYSLYFGKYYYVYQPVDPNVCNIWVLPTGSRREQGSSQFQVSSWSSRRREFADGKARP